MLSCNMSQFQHTAQYSSGEDRNSGSLNCSLHAPMYNEGQDMLDSNCLPLQFYADIKIHPWNKAKGSPAAIQHWFPQKKHQQWSCPFLGTQDLSRFLIMILIRATWQQFSKTVRNMKLIPTCDCSSSSSSSGSAGDDSVAVTSSSQLPVSPSSPRTSCNSA